MRRLLVLGVLLAIGAFAVPAAAVTPPPSGADVDYQLGGVRPVPARVGIVVRDREARPVPGRYNVCYVNGFQTQPGERPVWRGHADLVLRDHGRPVVDEAWGSGCSTSVLPRSGNGSPRSSDDGPAAAPAPGTTRSSTTTSTRSRAATAC